MRMIHLRFENARLFPQNKKTPKNWVFSKKDGKYIQDTIGAENYDNPITVNIVANVMRALTGDIPVPTLKPNSIGKNPIFEDLANNAFIKYDAERTDKKGKPAFTECMNTNKSHLKDSHNKITQEFKLFNGETYIAKGSYNWYTFEQTFSNDNHINKDSILMFIKETIGIDDVRNLIFEDMIYELSKYWHTEEFEKKIKNFFDEKYTTNSINKPWTYVLFGCTYDKGVISRDIPTGSNGSYKGKTPLLYTKGITSVMYVSGEIYCPIVNEMIDCLSGNMGSATILDGGLVYIIGLENWDEECLIDKGYEKIMTREQAINICKSVN